MNKSYFWIIVAMGCVMFAIILIYQQQQIKSLQEAFHQRSSSQGQNPLSAQNTSIPPRNPIGFELPKKEDKTE